MNVGWVKVQDSESALFLKVDTKKYWQ